ncbi:sensor histidine kinase [Microbacterium sp. PAMC22086]|uniref:sensor histidine kinase n=1 Tax=Microbacterium sp. PAMC22086 TaxID=2861281 RepID=UPI001C629276|nr:histidine kinase [Microbacterium sp. PAMC22086]QYG11907.1 hypothetical protein KY497_00760 [Microbacterium sp. PAMC22086]
MGVRPGFTASRNWWVRFDDRRAWQVTRQSPFVVLLVSCLLFCGLWLTVLPAETVLRWVQLGLGIVVIAGAVLVSRFPLVAVSVTVGATGAGWALGLTADPFVVAGFVVFTYAEQRGMRRIPWWIPVGALLVLLVSLGLSAEGVEDRFRGVLLGGIVLSTSWFLGVRTRQVAEASAERSRTEERLRLSRDVHDVLSHSLGSIGVRAGVAAHVVTLSEGDLRGVLREMERDARTSLTELKGLLQRERSTSPGAGNAGPALSLAGGLTDLARSAERAGLQIRVDAPVALDDLPVAVRTTLYRVAQEAVTNTIRHAAASSLTIAVSVLDGACRVEVRDDGAAAAFGFREGHGLMGMRERVESLGGTLVLTAAPTGFVVAASLPLPAPESRITS